MALEQGSKRFGRITAYVLDKDPSHNSTCMAVAMYRCESWTFKKVDEKRISAFEVKRFRQVLRVSWTAKRTNEWVLETAGVSSSLLASVKEMKLAYYGYILRKKGTVWRRN